MPVEIRWRKVSYFDGTPYARKLARTVWSGGKDKDNIKVLPIAIQQHAVPADQPPGGRV